MDTFDIALRLSAAALAGVTLGLNRDLHGKPTGVRTLGLVALGSALVVLAIAQGSNAEASRVIQGIVTGIGSLGAGVIVRKRSRAGTWANHGGLRLVDCMYWCSLRHQ